MLIPKGGGEDEEEEEERNEEGEKEDPYGEDDTFNKKDKTPEKVS